MLVNPMKFARSEPAFWCQKDKYKNQHAEHVPLPCCPLVRPQEHALNTIQHVIDLVASVSCSVLEQDECHLRCRRGQALGGLVETLTFVPKWWVQQLDRRASAQCGGTWRQPRDYE